MITSEERARVVYTIRALAAEAGDVDPNSMSDDEIVNGWDGNHSACDPPHTSQTLLTTRAVIAARLCLGLPLTT